MPPRRRHDSHPPRSVGDALHPSPLRLPSRRFRTPLARVPPGEVVRPPSAACREGGGSTPRLFARRGGGGVESSPRASPSHAAGGARSSPRLTLTAAGNGDVSRGRCRAHGSRCSFDREEGVICEASLYERWSEDGTDGGANLFAMLRDRSRSGRCGSQARDIRSRLRGARLAHGSSGDSGCR
ncbi:unnamed protein product [Urochloa humidicola]